MIDALANLSFYLDVMAPCARATVVNGLQGVGVLAAAAREISHVEKREARSHLEVRLISRAADCSDAGPLWVQLGRALAVCFISFHTQFKAGSMPKFWDRCKCTHWTRRPLALRPQLKNQGPSASGPNYKRQVLPVDFSKNDVLRADESTDCKATRGPATEQRKGWRAAQVRVASVSPSPSAIM